RLSILWEWLHKAARLSEDDVLSDVKSGDVFSSALYQRLLEEEYSKLLAAKDKDVHDSSKQTTLPIAREIVDAYIRDEIKPPWYIDLLNLNLGVEDVREARRRIRSYVEAYSADGTRITRN